MPVNFSTTVYLPAMDTFSVPCTIFPLVSRPGIGPYDARGILSTHELNVIAEDGSIISTQQTIFDVRDVEFDVVPQQHDRIHIAVDCNGQPQGEFEIIDASINGGGQTTLVLRKWRP